MLSTEEEAGRDFARFRTDSGESMPTKRRVPKDRAPKITPEAIALFRRGLELQAMGADDVFDDSDELSDEREEYNAIWRRLHWGLLHIAPNEAGPLDVQPGEVHEAAEGWLESVPKALELRALLMKGKTS